jgi:DNA-binding GntR family transcriptional regulator
MDAPVSSAVISREQPALSGQLLDRITRSILTGEFPPGLRLTEADLAERYNVSRAPLREALLRLEERQLIERIPFSGMRVFRASTRMLTELYDIREALEGLAARRAAQVITATHVEELRAGLKERHAQRARLRAQDLPQPTIGDIHHRIAELSGNRELLRMLGQEIWQLHRANYERFVRSPERQAIGAIEHERILDALEAHDSELAEMLMRRHIQSSRRAWEANL